MSDSRLRDLERAAAGGDLDAQARLWAELVRQGKVDPEAGAVGVFCRDWAVAKALGYRLLDRRPYSPPSGYNPRRRALPPIPPQFCTCPEPTSGRRVHHETCRHSGTPGPIEHTALVSPSLDDGPFYTSEWVASLWLSVPPAVVLRALIAVAEQLTVRMLERHPFFGNHQAGCPRQTHGASECDCPGPSGRENAPTAVRWVLGAARSEGPAGGPRSRSSAPTGPSARPRPHPRAPARNARAGNLTDHWSRGTGEP